MHRKTCHEVVQVEDAVTEKRSRRRTRRNEETVELGKEDQNGRMKKQVGWGRRPRWVLW